MTRSIEPVRGLMPEVGYAPPSGGGGAMGDPTQPAAPGLFANMHRLLRGRYVWVVLLAALLGGAGGYTGYKLWEPMYQSVGQIRISPTVPRMLYKLDDQDMSGVYDGYIDTQTSLLASTRLADSAMQSDAWKALKRPYGEDSLRLFKESLRVSRSKGSQIVSVSFTDGEPAAAVAATQSIIEEYIKVYSEEDSKQRLDRDNFLANRKTTLTNELKSLNDRVQAIAAEYGSRTLDTAYNIKLARLHELEGKVMQLQTDRAQFESDAKSRGLIVEPQVADDYDPDFATPSPEPMDRILTAKEIGARDKKMAEMLAELEGKQLILKKLRDNRNDIHPAVKAAAKEVRFVEERIEEYASQYNNVWIKAEEASTRKEVARRVMLMKENELRLVELTKPLRLEVQDIGRKNLQISRLDTEIKTVTAYLRETESEIEKRAVESYVTGRMTVVSKGERPGLPINASAQTRQATMGGVGGAALAVGLFLLWGFLDRRTRYVDDVQTILRNAPLLGVIPEIPARGSDPQVAMAAAMSVNQIRAMLQLGAVAAGRRVFAIVSGSPSEGKTSVTLSLGTSFANSGGRTLLIDFDLSGRNLSARSGCMHRAPLGAVLKSLGLVSDEDIHKSMQWARENGMRIGRAMTDLGIVTPADVEAALKSQEGTALGLIDALAGEPLRNCIIGTQTPRLFVLPVGEGRAHNMTSMSPDQVRGLIERAREDFDIVLIDTGPLPASLEGSVAAAHVDDAVVVISRDSQRSSLERVIQHLHTIDTSVAGLVFNRANQSCLNQYSSSSSLSRSVSRPIRRSDYDQDKADFGPMATATARSTQAADPAAHGKAHGKGHEGKSRGRHSRNKVGSPD